MCDFYSGIITKKGKVLDGYKDSHSSIKKEYKLNDDVKEINDLVFFPFEILPKDGKTVFDEPIKKNWELNISASHCKVSKNNMPDWLVKDLEKFEPIIWNGFKKQWNERILINKTVKELKEPKYYFLKDTTVKSMHGSSIIKSMHGSSTVKSMHDSSIVKSMHGSSIVESMCSIYTLVIIFNNNIVKYHKQGIIHNWEDDKCEIIKKWC